MAQNLTVRLDAETIQKARVLAARRSTSISRFIAEEIERLVGEDERYERARAAALADLARGFDLGSGGHLPPRESVYDR